MHAVILTGHGGLDRLDYRTGIPTPRPNANANANANELLIKTAVAGINNTDINTRIGWHSKTVTEATNTGGAEGFEAVGEDDVFTNLIRYIEAYEIRPVVAKTYSLRDIAQAQEDFLSKSHTGKLVLIPPNGTA
ncbi:zinc-binding dehydrogenase [Ascidiaceihabitans sp.]|uniref:zinc-binding dehydrogenase n=1 Tax=Ascidiaceihabitans sp. TaxID=1872644 RepID=UPI003298E5B8